MDQRELSCVACVAEMPSNATFVAVSKPMPDKVKRGHKPALCHEPKQRLENPGEKATIVEQDVEIFVRVGTAPADVPQCAPDRAKDDDVCRRDGKQEERQDQRADKAPHRLERTGVTEQRRRSVCDRNGEDDQS